MPQVAPDAVAAVAVRGGWQVDEWSRETETGDRAEMADLPEDLPFWPEIAATSENCIGADCPRFNDCFVTKMRQRAAESDVVIVNHHLLCADASVRQSAFGEVIPSCQYAIVDRSASSACRESRRVCWTMIGTSDSMRLA